MDALKFHGHKCWASVAGVRVGLAALRGLGVKRSGGVQLYEIVEIGEDHGGMCFRDGVQYSTVCTFGKDNIRKQPLGKVAFTLIEKDTNRAVRIASSPPCKSKSPHRLSCKSALQDIRRMKLWKKGIWN